ncbi:SusC/RagA family TonB-linked outer membrane protein, partial [Bacteroidales bacterium OttesenSCG-928-I14]|nr:SusC/RagA family TonB-linked outer membrane protein [Bacteroidales bacterium OttesenSCG-928-I14]
AAALYGSRAGNGVVLVTTKKGVGKEGLGISYGTTFTWTDVAETLDMQTTYGQGLNGVYDSKTPYSYGEKLEGQSVSAWWDNTETTAYKQYGTKLRDYFNTGFSQNHNLSIGNMDENSHYRLSLGYLDSKGLFEGESLNKINVDLNSGRKINKFLSMDSKISLSKTRAENRPYLGIYGEMYQLVYLPNNINLSDLESNYTRKAIDEQTGSEYDLHKNWVGPTQDIRNPYWVRNQRTNMDERWRVFGYHSMKANITDWLWVSGKAALDYYRTKIEETDKGFGGKIEDIIMNSQLDKSEINFYEINLDAMIQGYNNIGEKIRVDYTVGVNSSYRNNESLEASARNMAEQGKWYLNNAGQQVVNMEGGGIPTYANQTLTRKKVNSVFGLLQFAYDEYLSLDFTLRNDWSSTLPPENNSYDYPSINLSFLGTEFIKKVGGTLPSWWTFGKLRASFAKAGKDTKEYTLDNYKYWRQSFTGPLFSYASMAVNRDLVPEINTSFEGGLEMKFFDNRLGFDLTGYHSVTDGQIMMVPNSTSSIFKYRRVNAGVVKNVGVEFALYSSIIRTKDFNFDLNLNVSHNVSTVEDLYKGVTYIDLDRDNLFIQVGAVEGGKLGDIYAKSKIKRDADGNMIINEYTGLPETDTKSNREERKIGNIQPKMLASLTPQISYKNFHISALFDMRLGGEIVSVTEAIATQFGTAKRTEDRNETIILPGVYANGETNTKSIRREDYYRFISDAGGNSGMAEEFIYDASYIKLRELSAGYSLPTKWLKKTPFQTFRLSFVARDLCYLFKNTPGTTPEGGFDTTMYSQAMDFLAIPNNRTIGFSVNVSF